MLIQAHAPECEGGELVRVEALPYLSNADLQKIPKKLWQTYNRINFIPTDVFENVKQYAPGYAHNILCDEEAVLFLNTYYSSKVVRAFPKLQGAHKADLLRYGLLYIWGGVYADKTGD